MYMYIQTSPSSSPRFPPLPTVLELPDRIHRRCRRPLRREETGPRPSQLTAGRRHRHAPVGYELPKHRHDQLWPGLVQIPRNMRGKNGEIMIWMDEGLLKKEHHWTNGGFSQESWIIHGELMDYKQWWRMDGSPSGVAPWLRNHLQNGGFNYRRRWITVAIPQERDENPTKTPFFGNYRYDSGILEIFLGFIGHGAGTWQFFSITFQFE